MKKSIFEEPEFQLIRFSVGDAMVVASNPGEGGVEGPDIPVSISDG